MFNQKIRKSVPSTIIVSVMVAALLSASYYIQSLAVAHAQATSNQVRISTDKLIGILPLSIALNQNLFKDEGIGYSLNFFPTSSQVAQSLVSGQADMGGPISSIDLSILESKAPGKFKIFSLLAENSSKPVSAILVKKDSPYKSIQDLKGKKLGVGPGAFFGFLSKILVEKYFNNDPNAVQFITVPPGSWVSALQTGAVDAVFSVEPFTTIAMQNGGARVLLPGAQSAVINPIPIVGFAFTTDFVNKNPQQAAGIVKAIDKALSVANKDPEKAREALVSSIDINKSIADKVSLNTLYNSTQLDDIKPQLQALADLLTQKGYIDKKIDVSTLFYKK